MRREREEEEEKEQFTEPLGTLNLSNTAFTIAQWAYSDCTTCMSVCVCIMCECIIKCIWDMTFCVDVKNDAVFCRLLPFKMLATELLTFTQSWTSLTFPQNTDK